MSNVAESGPRAMTNAVFLLGAYMLIMLDMAPGAVAERFAGLDPALMEPYRDASYSPPDFRLSLLDCWSGIHRAIAHRWLARPSHPGSPLWGRINIAEYAQYDDPLNADLHEVVPGKLVAFRGPRELCGASYRDRGGVRYFSPAFFVPILRELGATTVLQLDDPAYDPAAFAAAGIAHHRLSSENGPAPTPAAATRFFAIVDAATGPVAVHCAAAAGPHRHADRAVPDAAVRLRGAGGDGVAAGDAAGVGDRGAAALPGGGRGGAAGEPTRRHRRASAADGQWLGGGAAACGGGVAPAGGAAVGDVAASRGACSTARKHFVLSSRVFKHPVLFSIVFECETKAGCFRRAIFSSHFQAARASRAALPDAHSLDTLSSGSTKAFIRARGGQPRRRKAS